MQNYLRKKNDSNLFEESSWFKDFFQTPFFKQDSILKTDIIEKQNDYTLVIDVPGCNKNDVKISCEDGYLTVEVNYSGNSDSNSHNYIKRERWNGVSSRSYYIGNTIDSKKINATFSNGVLEITFPKEEPSTQVNYIPIKEGK